MSVIRIIFFSALITIVGACATQPKIHSVFDESVDFSKFKTYAFLENADSAGYDTLADKYIKHGITSNMENRGMTLSDNPDVLVGYNIHKQEKIQTSTSSSPSVGYGGYYGYRSRYGYGGSFGTTTQVSQYTEGTLNIDVVDPQRKQLIWEGVAVGRLKDKVPEDAKEKVVGIVDLIFADYPVAGSVVE